MESPKLWPQDTTLRH